MESRGRRRRWFAFRASGLGLGAWDCRLRAHKFAITGKQAKEYAPILLEVHGFFLRRQGRYCRGLKIQVGFWCTSRYSLMTGGY